MSYPVAHVDAFTDRPFGGNPAAVCLLDRPRTEDWMQQVATELRASATAFLERDGEGFRLRWFTPKIEIALCGHATLASAHWLWETERVPRTETIRFFSKSGELGARSHGDTVELDFPAQRESVAAIPDGLVAGLGGASIRYCGRNATDLFVLLESESAVRRIAPDFARLAEIPVRGVIVTAPADPGRGYDFVSRFFAPSAGIDEDPATGSAHCCLSPFWSAALGRLELNGYQASPRGGFLRVRLEGDRVVLGGRAVTIWSGLLSA